MIPSLSFYVPEKEQCTICMQFYNRIIYLLTYNRINKYNTTISQKYMQVRNLILSVLYVISFLNFPINLDLNYRIVRSFVEMNFKRTYSLLWTDFQIKLPG